MLELCKSCGARLVEGPDVERSASGKGFACEISGIPTKICPSGCAGYYWADPDFGASVLELLSQDSENIARRNFWLLQARSLCRQCRTELIDNHQSATFTFREQPVGATTFKMNLTAPSLTCPKCLKQYIPAQKSSQDRYYSDMCDVIAQAITQELGHK